MGDEGVEAEEGEDEQEEDSSDGDADSEWTRIMYTERIKMFLRQEERLKAAMIGLYNVAWGQCSRRMKDQVEASDGFAEIKKKDMPSHRKRKEHKKRVRVAEYQIDENRKQ